jgi:hypothetical protein
MAKPFMLTSAPTNSFDGWFWPPFTAEPDKVRNQGCQMVYFQTKNPNLVKFWNVYAMEDVGVLYGHLVNFTAIGYNYWLFAIIHFHVLVCCSKKYLATLFGMRLRTTTLQHSGWNRSNWPYPC